SCAVSAPLSYDRTVWREPRGYRVGCRPMIMIEASSSASPGGMLAVGNEGCQGRRRPPALLHQPTPLVRWARLACPKHGRLSRESRGGNRAAPPPESRACTVSQGRCPLP